jgi:hypothetical protein
MRSGRPGCLCEQRHYRRQPHCHAGRDGFDNRRLCYPLFQIIRAVGTPSDPVVFRPRPKTPMGGMASILKTPFQAASSITAASRRPETAGYDCSEAPRSSATAFSGIAAALSANPRTKRAIRTGHSEVHSEVRSPTTSTGTQMNAVARFSKANRPMIIAITKAANVTVRVFRMEFLPAHEL